MLQDDIYYTCKYKGYIFFLLLTSLCMRIVHYSINFLKNLDLTQVRVGDNTLWNFSARDNRRHSIVQLCVMKNRQ